MKMCLVLDPVGDPTADGVLNRIHHLMSGYNGFENSMVGKASKMAAPGSVNSVNNI